MTIRSNTVATGRGDSVMVSLFTWPNSDSSILVTIVDADDCTIPTAEFSLPEAGRLRDILSALLQGAEDGIRPG